MDLTSAKRLLISWLQLVRWHVVVPGVIYTYLGAYLASGSCFFNAAVGRAATVVAFVIAFGNVINDCIDAPADTIALRQRPIPCGKMSLRAGWTTMILLGAGAVLLSVHARPQQQFVVFLNLLLSAMYSIRLKGVLYIGHASVGLLCGSILIYGSMASGQVTRAAVAAGFIAFLHIFASELLSAVRDEDRDRASGVTTTVTRIGRTKSIRLFSALSIIAAIVAVWPWAAGFASSNYLAVLIPLTILPTLWIAFTLSFVSDDKTLSVCALAGRLVWYSSLVPLALLR
jgi:4-hydroxybenzoate polyprenyltransferase